MSAKARRYRFALLLIAAVMTLPLMAAIPLDRASAESKPSPTPGPASYVFDGGGWGHAVGLSQWGAYGQAKLDGARYRAILRHYYTGTDTGRLGEDATDPGPLWVNLEREVVSLTLRVKAIRDGGTTATVKRKGPDLELAPGEAFTISVDGRRADGSPRCVVTAESGFEDPGPCNLDVSWDGETADPTTRLVVESVQRGEGAEARPCLLPDWNSVPTRYRECAYSRGVLHVRPDNDAAAFHLVVEIDIEDYVLGISEMPYYWSLPTDGPNGLEALKAQAVAARSYAARRAIDRGDPEARPSCWCHVHDTTVDQRYVGWGHSGLGQDGWLEAVRSTAGIVVTHPAINRNGAGLPILAFYSSSSYGQTEPAELGFGTRAVYLESVDDRWAIDPALRNPQVTWTRTLTATDIARRLGWPAGRTLHAVTVASCSPSGAVSEVRFTDASGASETRPTRTLRTTLGLRSPQITTINGVAPCRGNGEPRLGVAAADLLVDDDASGDSVGNGDGAAQCGETVELRTVLANAGNTDLTGLAADLSTADGRVSIDHNVTSAFGNLPVLGTSRNANDWDVTLAEATGAFTAVFAADVRTDQGGPWRVEFRLPVGCGAEPPPDGELTVEAVEVDDGPGGDSVGNGDGAAQCGELIELFVTLHNGTSSPLQGLEAKLSLRGTNGEIVHNLSSDYPDLEAGARARNANDWDIRLAPDANRLRGTLTVTTDGGLEWPLELSVPVRCDGGPEGEPRPTIATVRVDDDAEGDSAGNGNGAAQCGEVVELSVVIANEGDARARGLRATFLPRDSRLSVLHNTSSRYGGIDPGKRKANVDDFDIAVAPGASAGDAAFRLRVTDRDGRVFRLDGALPIRCRRPPVSVGAVTVDDGVLGDSAGNNDKVAQCGERIELYVELVNRTNTPLRDVRAKVRSLGPRLDLLHNRWSTYPDLSPGGTAENDNDWDLDVAPRVPDGKQLTLELVVRRGDDRWVLPFDLTLRC